MPGTPEVVVLGDVNVDIVAHCAHLPARGACVRPHALTVHAGGAAANTAACLARLGRRVTLLGRVGSDPWARVPLDALARAGVDLDAVQRDASAPTGLIYTMLTPDGVRSTVAHQGANTSYRLDEQGLCAIRGARLLHLTGYAWLAEGQASAARQAVEVAREVGVAVTLDPCVAGPREVLEELGGLLGQLAAVLPNRAEAAALSGEADPFRALHALAGRCPGLVAITLDACGCMLARGTESMEVAAFPVGVVSPTGAGDAFAAAIVAGLLDDIGLGPLAVLANACGALTAMRAGAGEAAPTPDELAAFLVQPQALAPGLGAAVREALEVLGRWHARGARVASGADPL